jgi:hypothetical protein
MAACLRRTAGEREPPGLWGQTATGVGGAVGGGAGSPRVMADRGGADAPAPTRRRDPRERERRQGNAGGQTGKRGRTLRPGFGGKPTLRLYGLTQVGKAAQSLHRLFSLHIDYTLVPAQCDNR